MRTRLIGVAAGALLATGCGSDVDLSDEDDFQSYRDGYVWLSVWPEDEDCDSDTADHFEEVIGDDYETNRDAFLMGCKDNADGKMPRE